MTTCRKSSRRCSRRAPKAGRCATPSRTGLHSLAICEDGDLQIDNNGTERAIRGEAVGHNNWIFLGSDEGGRTAAVLRSFVASCQRVGVDPFLWFKDVLARIADHPIARLNDLLPHNWAPTQA